MKSLVYLICRACSFIMSIWACSFGVSLIGNGQLSWWHPAWVTTMLVVFLSPGIAVLFVPDDVIDLCIADFKKWRKR